jgi:hypothetical protein
MAFKRSNLIKLGVEQEELELEDLSIDQRLTPLLISESVWGMHNVGRRCGSDLVS